MYDVCVYSYECKIWVRSTWIVEQIEELAENTEDTEGKPANKIKENWISRVLINVCYV